MSKESQTVWKQAIYNTVSDYDSSMQNFGNSQVTLEMNKESRPFSFSRAQAITSIHTTTNLINTDTVAITRPFWSHDRLPILSITPIEPSIRPIAVDRFVLRPSPLENLVYIASSEVSLLDFSLTLRRSLLPDRGLTITGGSAFFSISIYAPHNLDSFSLLRKNWDVALKRENFGERNWSYRQEQRRGLSVSLELPSGIAKDAPLIFTSPMSGVAIITVELTGSGALLWKAALEQGAGSTIPGIFRVSSSSLGIAGLATTIDRQSLDTAVGRLLSTRSAADILYIDPQQTVQGKLIVVTNDLVEQVAVAVRPNQGQAPANQTFGREGGQIEVSVSTQEVASVDIEWSAQVAFSPLGWPPVPASGHLSSANIWTDMIKPDSWIVNYTLLVIPVDDRGQVQAVDVPSTPPLQGVLNFTASYVSNGHINSSFQAGYFHPINIALPRFPGQEFGTLMLTIFSARNGRGASQSRKLAPDEVNIIVLIHPDARVEVHTDQDPVPEVSLASEVLRLMASL